MLLTICQASPTDLCQLSAIYYDAPPQCAENDKYPDRKFLKRISQKNYKAWQFACERLGFFETKTFSDSKFGGSDGAYNAAIKYRNEFFQAASSLGVFDKSNDNRHNATSKRLIQIDLKLSPNNTSGIIGVCRSISKRDSRKSPEITWRAGYKNSLGQNRQKSYSVGQLGEQQALFRAVTFRRDYAKSLLPTTQDDTYRIKLSDHIEELNSILEYISDLKDEADVFFFLGSLNNPHLDNTSKKQMLDIRVGQNKFRRLILSYWNNKCAVTGSSLFVTAGHIKPWKDSDNSERIDVFNGLALSPVYDKAFDKGYISFDKNGNILISNKLSHDAELLGINKYIQISNLHFLHQKYLEWHRNFIFIK